MVKSLIANNIYGVDINPESVEIARLALWLHTALPGKQLCMLDDNIRCGNSLVGSDFADFYQRKHETLFDEADERERERINAFDWRAAFPQVFAAGGFDCVIGNPPYVKLQHFRKAEADAAEYLVQARRADGAPLYESTQTGNFDMYLPFIEKGIELLKPDGRMGFIAPNVWMMNEYGAGLRAKLKRRRNLERWIDFKSHQVFDGAITYTALQFFRGCAGPGIRCVFAPDGDISAIDWDAVPDHVPYDELPDDGAWNLLPNVERKLLSRLSETHPPLGDSRWTKQIFQGLITSADHIYHLTRLGSGRYLHRSKEKQEVEVGIEDGLMRPLVSGPEAKRYRVPKTDTWLLFPYDISGEKPRLYTEAEMRSKFPRGWEHLGEHEDELRAREGGKFDDDQWYRFGRHQNIDRQECPKLGVAQTVPSLRLFFDDRGQFYFNNVRVNGILPAPQADAWYLLGVLNCKACDFIFRRIAKSKEGGWFEANKQFLAPLAIPDAPPAERDEIGRRARGLQELHTNRRDKVAFLQEAILSDSTLPDSRTAGAFLWADVRTVADWKKEDTEGRKGKQLTDWAKAKREETLNAHFDEINPRFVPGARLDAKHTQGVLRFLVDGAGVVQAYPEEDEADFIAAQWRQVARTTNVTEKFDAKRLVKALLTLRKTTNKGLLKHVLKLDAEIQALDAAIEKQEREMNQLVYSLYKLTDAEIELVESDRR